MPALTGSQPPGAVSSQGPGTEAATVSDPASARAAITPTAAARATARTTNSSAARWAVAQGKCGAWAVTDMAVLLGTGRPPPGAAAVRQQGPAAGPAAAVVRLTEGRSTCAHVRPAAGGHPGSAQGHRAGRVRSCRRPAAAGRVPARPAAGRSGDG